MKKHFKYLSMAAIAASMFAACSDVPELPYPFPGDDNDTTEVGGIKTLPYSESFSSSLGEWTNETTSGEGAWVNDYSTAKATGYDNASQTTTAGTYYLISPEISLEGVEEAYIAYEYILRYNKGDENQKVLISANYTDDATMATWAVLKADHTEGADWVTFESADINIPAEYMDKTIRIAFYYNTNNVSGSTWEVRNFTIAEGKASEGGNDDNEEPVEPEGDTLSVAQAIALNDGEKHWVKGYIVGYISQSYEYTFTADANASETNLLIADSKDCTDETSCMPVQLPAGNIRSALNLKANPENLGKVLTINGQLTNYFKVPGIKSASEYKLEGEDNNDTPETPDTPTDAYYSNSLLGNEGGFAAYDVNLGSLGYVWQNTTSYGWKASAYTSSAVAAESWLVSPAIDLSGAKSPIMTFEQALNHLKDASRTAHVNAYIATDFAGDIAAATWQELTLNEWPAGADWSFITSTTDLATYAGKSIYIAFKYVSTSAVAPTWEFKNLTIAEK